MESYYRKPVTIDNIKPFSFQTLVWETHDECIDEGEPDEFIIRAFGTTSEGNSVCCTIRNFKPYFYIKVPQSWGLAHFKDFVNKLKGMKSNGKNVINYYVKDSLLINDCKIEKWVNYYGFCNGEQSKFVKMVFANQKGMKSYMYAMKKMDLKVELFDTNLDPILKFFHQVGIQPTNHIKVTKYFEDVSSRCQINIECDYRRIECDIKQINNAFLQASYDIETYSQPKITENGKEYYPFPIPENPANPVYQIATCFKRFGSENFLVKHIFTLKNCNHIEDLNTIVECCSSEKDLITRWVNLIVNMDPDILYSYNGNMFDDNYIWVRAKQLGLTKVVGKLSRINDYLAEVKDGGFSSSAYGKSEYKRLIIPGVLNYDILITIRREFKENSYKLDYISEKYLGEKKNPVSVVDIFKAYESGDPEKIKVISSYCVQDTRLPVLLVDKLHLLLSQISMSNVTSVTIKMLIERGQEIKSLSQISLIAKKKGFLMPMFEYTEGLEGFEGALVLTPRVGLYNVVTTVDFEGLYPSIIRAHNLCFTSVVMNPEYLNLPGIEYTTVNYSEDEPPAIFATNVETVLPGLLVNLYNERKKYKKLMKNAETSELKAIYDRTQLAVKISANSVYGILGSKTIGYKPIAASVTHYGREMLKQTKNYIETHHHSVYPENYDTDVLESQDTVTIKSIDDKVIQVKVEDTINYPDCEIKTDAGWRKLLGLKEL